MQIKLDQIKASIFENQIYENALLFCIDRKWSISEFLAEKCKAPCAKVETIHDDWPDTSMWKMEV